MWYSSAGMDSKAESGTLVRMVMSLVNVGVGLIFTLCFIMGPGVGIHGKLSGGQDILLDVLTAALAYSVGLVIIAGCTYLSWGKVIRSQTATLFFAMLPTILALIGLALILIVAA